MNNWKKWSAAAVTGAMVCTSMMPVMAADVVSQDGKYLGGYQEAYARSLAKTAAEEGIILLDNRGGVLPWNKEKVKKVALFGLGATNTLEARNKSQRTGDGTKISTALEAAGYEITSYDFLETYKDGYQEGSDSSGADWQGMQASSLSDGPLTDEMVANASEADVAIYVIARDSEENTDRTIEEYYLTDIEKENIKKMAENFETSIIVMNCVCAIDTNFYQEIEGLDALVMMGEAGVEGGAALVEILEGTVTPSGKTTYTWAKEYEDYSSSNTFAVSVNDVDYDEGIYVGYRYFDTFNVEPMYEFGYGLSYTDFEIETTDVTVDAEKVTVKTKVTNTGDKYSGKEVVEVYFSAPDGELEKAYQELAAYGKTDELEPGQSQELTITFDTTEMSSYSEARASYIMEAGDYLIRVGDSSRNTEVAAVITLDETAVTEILSNQLEAIREIDELSKYQENGEKVASYTYEGEAEEIENAQKLNLQAADIPTENNASEYDDETVTTYRTQAMLDQEAEEEAYYSNVTSVETGATSEEGIREAADPETMQTGGYIPWDDSKSTLENMMDYYANPQFYTYPLTSTITPVYTDKTGANGYNNGEGYEEKVEVVEEKEDMNLLGVYNGEYTLEEFVGNMTTEQLVFLVNGAAANKTFDWVSGTQRSGAHDFTGLFSSYGDDIWTGSADICNLDIMKESLHSESKYENGRSLENWDKEEWRSLGIPTMNMNDGPGKVIKDSIAYTGEDAAEDSEGITVTAAFPSSPVMASTWNIDLLYECGTCSGYDLANFDCTIWLAPGANLIRNVLCGRNGEYYSEDPVVTGLSAAATINGVQSVPGVGCMVKHFAMNNQETGRSHVNTVASERTERELYLKGFEIIVKSSQPMAIMTSYNVVQGLFTAGNYDLTTSILRGEWGFEGLVCTDWESSAPAADSMHAGNDLMMPGGRWYELFNKVAWTEPDFLENGEIEVSSELAYGPHKTFVSLWGDFVPETVESADTVLPDEYIEEGWEVVGYMPTYWKDNTQAASDCPQETIYYVAKTDENGNITEYKGTYVDNDRIYVGDLQKCAMNILKVVMQTQNMKILYGDEIKLKSWNSQFDLNTYVTAEKGEIQ